jgi:uncharacterized repeat protein (TIGR03803 family)
VVIAANGQLYGATLRGGTGPCQEGCGTVFELIPPAEPGAGWTETVLYRFKGPPDDGAEPPAAPVIGRGGALYGTAMAGNIISDCIMGKPCGIVFELTPPSSPGSSWTEAVLHSFSGSPSDGNGPIAGVAIGTNGVLYGTTLAGGTSDDGTVFGLAPPATPDGQWTETMVYSLSTGVISGACPYAGVVIGANGDLFGTTYYSDAGCNPFGGLGLVFQLTPPPAPGGSWSETVLYEFTGQNGGGYSPSAGLVIGANGALYGTTLWGGPDNAGTVFELTQPAVAGGNWTETVLHTFTRNGGDGASPYAGLAIGKSGALYGTTGYGGSSQCSCGTVFELTPPSVPGGSWTETILHSFAGSDGAYPAANVVLGKDGVLYGTTSRGGASNRGTVFKLTP